MSHPFRLSPRVWVVVPLLALGFVVWSDAWRVQRVEYLSHLAGENAVIDASSPTGYAGGKRWLIVPEHDNPTYQSIEETQLMLARGEWRVRRIDYENAPFGRDVHTASPYHWWLALIAWCTHIVSGRPLGLAVAQAALWADPLVHLLLLGAATVVVARRFGALPAALLSLGLAAIYPLGAAFLPGIASDFCLVEACALGSVLLLVAGAGAGPRASRWFFAAGALGGCGLWLSADLQTPILEGIALGALLAALLMRGAGETEAEGAAVVPPWRAWALGGAGASLAGYLLEYFPNHLATPLRVNNPLYALAWLGAGECLWRFAAWMRRGTRFPGWRDLGASAVAVAAVAALPIAIARGGNRAFLSGNLLDARLTSLPDGVVAGSLKAWLMRDGCTGAFGATGLAVLLLVPPVWLLARRSTGAGPRTALAIALGPAAVALAHAVRQIRWWNTFDAALLALAVAATAAMPATSARRGRWLWGGLVALVLGFGLVQLWPPIGTVRQNRFTQLEVEEFYERAVAHWIADRSGPNGAVVLVPPFRTASFCFYGGLRGLGTPNWENRDGVAATVDIASAGRSDQAQALINQRGVNYLVLPSWDSDLEEFARLSLSHPEQSFIEQLQHWTVFDWLKPQPYHLPAISGFAEPAVTIWQVVPEGTRATSIGRLTEYFIEMQRLDLAAYGSRALRRYPSDLGALAAMAQVAKASGDEAMFAKVFRIIVSDLRFGADRRLPWDRRVSLAVVLALGGRNDLAREQVRRCLAEADDGRLRSLTTGSLYHLDVLVEAFGLRIADPGLRELSRQLLPEELRDRLQARAAAPAGETQ